MRTIYTTEKLKGLTNAALHGDRIACLDLASFLMAKGDRQMAEYWRFKADIIKQQEKESLTQGYTVEFL